jgi:hypothetical protein
MSEATLREIQVLLGDQGREDLYLDGLRKLFDSGVITALRAIGRPQRVARGTSLETMASEGSYSAGFNDAIDCLLYFKELYLDRSKPEFSMPRLGFGALEELLARGDISKDESDAIKRGEPVKYDAAKHTNNLTNPADGKLAVPRKHPPSA